MQRKKYGYTLLELMIVIGVILVLLTVTMRFGSSRIYDLTMQTIKEEFIQTYSRVYSQVMASNYLGDRRYASLQIVIGSGNNGFDYSLSGDVEAIVSGFAHPSLLIGPVSLDGALVPSVDVLLSPYEMSCDLVSAQSTGKLLSFSIVLGKTSARSCFLIDHNLCKLHQVVCGEASDL